MIAPWLEPVLALLQRMRVSSRAPRIGRLVPVWRLELLATHQGGGPRGLSSIASDRFSVFRTCPSGPGPSDLTSEAVLRSSFRWFAGKGRIRPRPGLSACLKGLISQTERSPQHTAATPANCPDILSSDAFQDLPPSGRVCFSIGMMGGGWSVSGCPTADCTDCL